MIKKQLVLIFLVSTILFSSHIYCQSPGTLIFNGKLTDMEEVNIANELCTIQFTILNSSDAVLFENTAEVSTDDFGNFIVMMDNLPALFTNSANKEMVVFTIKISAPETSNWLEESKFMVKYHFEKLGKDNYKITRFEGQVLNFAARPPVWDFNDIYPLAYLSSRFMISFSNEMEADSIIEICNEMNPPSEGLDEENAPAPTKERGIKSGYAIGGYKSGN